MKNTSMVTIILCAGIVLTSCGQAEPPTTPTLSSETGSSSEAPSSDTEQKPAAIGHSPMLGNPEPKDVRHFLDNMSNLDLMNYFAAASATGLGITDYQGFESPADIRSNGLMDFFIYASDPDDYYNPGTKQYTVSVAAINRFLDNYFEDVSFVPKDEMFFKNYYDAATEQFIMPFFMTKDVRGNSAITDRIDHEDGTVTIKANIYDIDDSLGLEGRSPIGQETLTVKIAHGKVFFQSYHVEFYK